MNNHKIDTIKWLVENINMTPGSKIWLASSGSIISGIPIDVTEYYRILFRSDHVQATPNQENILALKNVNIRQANANNMFNVALVDLEEITAWGVFDPEKSFEIYTPA